MIVLQVGVKYSVVYLVIKSGSGIGPGIAIGGYRGLSTKCAEKQDFDG